jgi:hypothetical protein
VENGKNSNAASGEPKNGRSGDDQVTSLWFFIIPNTQVFLQKMRQ